MSTRFLSLVLTGGLIAALAIFSACGGGDDDGGDNGNGGGELTVAEYFAAMEVAGTAYNARGEELTEELEERTDAAESDEDQINAASTFAESGTTVLAKFVSELAAINAPDEVSGLHEDAVEAGEDAVGAFEDLQRELSDAETASEIATLFGDAFLSDEFAAFGTSCRALQTYANENEISADLECPSE